MEEKFEIDINVIIELYKKRVGELENENILLQAQILRLKEELNKIQGE